MTTDTRIDAFYADMTRENMLDALDHMAEVEASEPDPDTAPDPDFADMAWPEIVEIIEEQEAEQRAYDEQCEYDRRNRWAY